MSAVPPHGFVPSHDPTSPEDLCRLGACPIDPATGHTFDPRHHDPVGSPTYRALLDIVADLADVDFPNGPTVGGLIVRAQEALR